MTSSSHHCYIKGHHPAVSPGVNPSSSRNQRTPGKGEILWEQQIGKNSFNFKKCFKARFSNVPNDRSKYQPWNLKHSAGKFVGGDCQASFGICTAGDKWCLEEYPLRWNGWKEGEGDKQVAKQELLAHSQQQNSRWWKQFLCVALGQYGFHSQAWCPQAAWKQSAPGGSWDRGVPGWSRAQASQDTAEMKARQERKGHSGIKPNGLFLFLSRQSPGREKFCLTQKTEGYFTLLTVCHL